MVTDMLRESYTKCEGRGVSWVTRAGGQAGRRSDGQTVRRSEIARAQPAIGRALAEPATGPALGEPRARNAAPRAYSESDSFCVAGAAISCTHTVFAFTNSWTPCRESSRP
jgi:hypothetical protein